MTYLYMVTEIVFGFIGGALLMRVWDVKHSMREMARRHSEDLLKSNLTNFDIGWEDCYQFVMHSTPEITVGLFKQVLTAVKESKRPGEPTMHAIKERP